MWQMVPPAAAGGLDAQFPLSALSFPLSATDSQLMSIDKSGRRVRQMFAEIARRYDLLNHLLSLGIDRSWRRRTVRLVPPEGSDPILDVCCGTGDLTLGYWRAGRGRSRVIGADFCRPMLEIGARKAARAGAADEVAFVEADAQRLPFPDGSFQIVSVAFGLRNVSDTDAGLREMARVCRPGGRVAVLEFSMPRNKALKTMYGWYFGRVLPRVGQALARNRQAAYNYLPASVGQFPQHEALAERMRAAGLGEVSFHPFTFGIATLYVGTK
jgi:demethylmenaquinone methyltransferase/2-methoxy-6-polyprenyl-1,4-benzoquinol methylase